MGCDGGTIPKRHELAKTKQKPEQKDADVERATKWSLCQLSSRKLKEPIVACQMGRLYNKDVLIEYLLDKSSQQDNMSHVKGLKSVTTLKLTANPAWTDATKKGDGYHDTNTSPYICPISQLEMNGKSKFCFLLQCCCVLSWKVLKEIGGQVCPQCSTPYDKDYDVVIINPQGDDVKAQKEKMLKRKEAKKEKRKSKKSKNAAQEITNGDAKVPTTSNGTASLTTLQKYRNMKRKSEQKKDNNKETEKLPDSDVYKSLFTTHHSAKRSKDQISCWETQPCS